MTVKIGEAARLTGITVRTLHYYDEIGLLKPSEISEAGYRVYNDSDIEILQQILFFRELDFTLAEIGRILADPEFDRKESLRRHRELLLEKRSRIDELILLVDKTLKGEKDMSFKQFDNSEILARSRRYADEVRRRWGDTAAYAEYVQKMKKSMEAERDSTEARADAIISEFAEIRGQSPKSAEAETLVRKWQAFITNNYYECTDEILCCLGQMYTGDERFRQNIDRHGIGTAEFMAKAIAAHCKTQT